MDKIKVFSFTYPLSKRYFENILTPLPLFSASLPSGLNILTFILLSFNIGPYNMPSEPTPKFLLHIFFIFSSVNSIEFKFGSNTR